MPDYPLVALEFMNIDHAEFVALRGKLLVHLRAQAPDTEVDSMLDELYEHTLRHFADEERLMLESCFPPYPVHKDEHDQVLANLAAQIERWNYGRDTVALSDWLEATIGAWFVNHVSTMDQVTATFIASRQQSK
jgi:hemerythrin